MRSYIKGQRCKRGRYLVKKLSVHMSLIVGSIVFSLPFLWLELSPYNGVKMVF